MVPVYMPVDTDNLFDHACDGADVMRDHYDGHAPIQLMQKPIQLFFELVVNEIRRFVENQQLRVGYDGPTQERPLQLAPETSPTGQSAMSPIPVASSKSFTFCRSDRV